MSKAIIKSNLGQGKYLVDVELDNRKGAALYQDIQSQISATELAISIKQSEYQTELDKYNYLASLINVSDTIEAQQKAIADARKQQLSMQQASRQLNLLKTKLNQLIIKIGQITPDETLKFECYGWSADSQEDISIGAVVGICDRNRENWKHSFVTIKPSYDGASNTGHLWVESDDGNFTKTDGMSAANYAYSYAMVDGADKFRPHYGYATISSINGSNYTLSNGETGTATFRDCSNLPYEVGDSVVYDSNFNIIGYQNQFSECATATSLCDYIRYIDLQKQIYDNRIRSQVYFLGYGYQVPSSIVFKDGTSMVELQFQLDSDRNAIYNGVETTFAIYKKEGGTDGYSESYSILEANNEEYILPDEYKATGTMGSHPNTYPVVYWICP